MEQKDKNKIKIHATVFPYEIKLLFVVFADTSFKDLKLYIQDSVRGFNVSFQIGKITTKEDYIFLNYQVSFLIILYI